MFKIAAAPAMLAIMLMSSTAIANAWSDKLAAEFVANFRDLCLTDLPFEVAAAKLAKQGRIQAPETTNWGFVAVSLQAKDPPTRLYDSTKLVPLYAFVYDLGMQRNKKTRSCNGVITKENYSNEVIKSIGELPNLRPGSASLVFRMQSSCRGRDCPFGLQKNQRAWELADKPESLTLLNYSVWSQFGTSLSHIELPKQ